ncbi:MAG: Uma2 family endonuclease [Capsulimonas sp.]|uniref:Uma2 family endonuclease n=1 Tax=Capsulimonas sp. TaxID=2494211 RepID=UPI0032672D78
MATQAHRLYTPEEYLAMERQAEFRSEYVHGEIFAMSGGSRAHSYIAGNAYRLLGNQLEGRSCAPFGSDMRVLVNPGGLYTYPDVSIACDPQFSDSAVDTLTNPIVIVEVLSPSTEAYDRGLKFAYYRRQASISHYVLIAQDQPHVELYTRQEDDKWLLTEINSLEGDVNLDAIGCKLPINKLYDRVEFSARPEFA